MRLFIVLPLALAAACTPRAVTPPGRAFPLASPNAPATGKSDAAVGLARIGTIWGPELVNGEGRLRHAVSDGVVVEADAGVLHLTNDGDSGPNRNAFTGRLGVMLRPPEWEQHDLRVGLSLGAGGGHSPAAGDWGSVDAAVLLAGSHRWIRPVIAAGGGLSRPFGDTTFTVVTSGSDGEPMSTTLQLPRNVTASFAAGIELGPSHSTVTIGASMTHFWLQESSVVSPVEEEAEDDGFFAIGLAYRHQIQ